MHPFRLIPALLAALLILAACAGQPAADTMDAAPARRRRQHRLTQWPTTTWPNDDMAESR